MTMYISPYRRLATLRDAMNRMIEDSMSETQSSDREMLLALDVQATDDGYIVTALVPGLEADDLDIEILNNTVSIRGEFPTSVEEDVKYLTCELPEGRFSRVIQLPATVDATKAEASLKNGVLKLNIPKAESHRPKAIKINAN